jgi:4-hydroxyacetophenone monooxygenase
MHADPFLLAAALARMTGDTGPIDAAWEASQTPGRGARDFPAALHTAQTAAMARLMARGMAPAAASPGLLARLVQFVAGEPVPPEYLPMLLEESRVVVRDLDAAPPVAPPAGRHRLPEVAIIGAGLSGIAIAIYLRQAGIPFTIYEQSDGIGGTWHDTRYPGAQVDTASHFYAYSFALNPAWPRWFSKQGEMLDYIARIVEEQGLRPHIRLGCTVEAAAWDEASGRWRCRIRPRDGAAFETAAEVLVSAVGQLNVPMVPAIPGLDRFAGEVVHTARWTPRADHRGRRVALVGTGASAVQAGPTMAKDAERLFVFQRSPQWLSHRPTYHATVDADTRWVLENVPSYAAWHRLSIIWQFGDKLYPALLTDDRGRASEANERLRQQWTGYITAKLASRPDLLARALPDYPPLTKRVPVDFGWFDMLLRDNVELVDTAVDHVGRDAIVTADGRRIGVDMIVLATGFRATRMLEAIDIAGAGGLSLRAAWDGDDPRAFLGITVPGFPNFFVMYGPNTNLGHGGSLIFQGECQARYIAQAVRHLAASGAVALDVRPEVFAGYNAEVDAQLARMVWGVPGVSNWFKNSKGRIVTNSPWRVVDYWQRTRRFEPADYAARMPAEAGAAG